MIHEKYVADDVRVIKRYANRKLYDTQHSRYVTLEQISDMIREGDDVQIIDNKTKEDLTSVTLAQIIFEEEKKQKSFLPLQTMRNIIATGGESITQLVTNAQRRVTDAFHVQKKGGEGAEGEALEVEVEAAPVAAPGPGAVERKPTSLPEFREWVVNTQRTIDEWQKRVDDRIRNVVEGISPFAGVQKDIRELANRIAELEGKLSVIAEEEADAQADAEDAQAKAAGAEASSADEDGPRAQPAANGDGSHVGGETTTPTPRDDQA